MMEPSARERYERYVTSLAVMVQADHQDLTNEFILAGIMAKFRLQFELSWKLLKALLDHEGLTVGTPREVIGEAGRVYDFLDQETWLAMLHDSNNSAHVCDGRAAWSLVDRILADYIPAFVKLQQGLEGRYGSLLAEKHI